MENQLEQIIMGQHTMSGIRRQFNHFRSIFFVLLLASCTSGHIKTGSAYDSIYVLYLSFAYGDDMREYPCERLKARLQRKECRAVYEISQEEFDHISKYIANQQECDTLRRCKHPQFYVEWNGKGFCFDNSNNVCTCSADGVEIKPDPKTLYLIKCRSGFYNHLTAEDVRLDYLVEQFGFPENYHFVNTNQELAPITKVDEAYKVAFVKKK